MFGIDSTAIGENKIRTTDISISEEDLPGELVNADISKLAPLFTTSAWNKVSNLCKFCYLLNDIFSHLKVRYSLLIGKYIVKSALTKIQYNLTIYACKFAW